MNSILKNFKFDKENEDQETVISSIKSGIEFKGINLWVLIFAIFIASLGLNVNSTAVIIGAMLISPLMGPIMGIGLGTAINDLELLRKSFQNYFLATTVALATSTLYFLVTPLNEAHSEILARTSPNIYDVLIALFGGLAGILATSSRFKGNVIQGVAIATALMPPLCTAGYGLATWKLEFFFGAFYLYIINTVLIATATFIMIRFLKYTFVQQPDEKAHQKTRRIIFLVAICTILPSLYFGYDIVQQTKFKKKAARFIEMEATFPNNYLLNKTIDPKAKSINLTFGGEEIDSATIQLFKNKANAYELEDAKIEIKQGFSYLSEKNNEVSSTVTNALVEKEISIKKLHQKLDSINLNTERSKDIYKELKALRPDLNYLLITKSVTGNESDCREFVIISAKSRISKKEVKKIETWLKTRLKDEKLAVIFQ